jgi:hypothetical protein
LKTDTLLATSQEPVEVLDPTAAALDGVPKPFESPSAIPAVLPVSAFTETVVATNPVASTLLSLLLITIDPGEPTFGPLYFDQRVEVSL